MTSDQAQQVAEKLGNAQQLILDALSIAERSSSALLACQIGVLSDRLGVLKERTMRKTVKKKPTMRQFIRANRL